MTIRILAIVVTYYPEEALLNANIGAFVNFVDKILIWENTPLQKKEAYRYIEHEKVEYCGDGKNSISHALNYAWRYAKKNGYDYLLTMDQDSQWENFCDFLNHTINDPNAPVGIWGPFHNSFKPVIMERDCIITSGMLVDISIINRIGGWNEFFDIDCVDDEFCLSAKRLGISSYVFGMCRMIHHLGNPKPVRVFKKSTFVPNYSYNRLYGIYKSHVSLLRMFPEVQSIRIDFWNYWIPQIKWIVVCENNHVKKFFAILGGILKGLVCCIPERYSC